MPMTRRSAPLPTFLPLLADAGRPSFPFSLPLSLFPSFPLSLLLSLPCLSFSASGTEERGAPQKTEQGMRERPL